MLEEIDIAHKKMFFEPRASPSDFLFTTFEAPVAQVSACLMPSTFSCSSGVSILIRMDGLRVNVQILFLGLKQRTKGIRSQI